MSEEMKDAIADLRRAMTRLELDLMDATLDPLRVSTVTQALVEMANDLDYHRKQL